MSDKDEILLDWAWRNLDDFWDDKRELDNKGSILLAANGIVLGFVANASSKLDPILFMLGLFFLIVSIVSCIISLMPHTFTRSTCEPHNTMCNLDSGHLTQKIYDELRGSYQENRSAYSAVLEWYVGAVYSFLVALLLIAISIIWPRLSS